MDSHKVDKDCMDLPDVPGTYKCRKCGHGRNYVRFYAPILFGAGVGGLLGLVSYVKDWL